MARPDTPKIGGLKKNKRKKDEKLTKQYNTPGLHGQIHGKLED